LLEHTPYALRPRRYPPLVLSALALLPLLAGATPVPSQAQAGFADPAFRRTWDYTDSPVAAHSADRSWTWGPAPGATVLEPLLEAPGGLRRVQYFDKSRMEINNPAGDPSKLFYVTNGLLATELMTGRLQVGTATFEPRCIANTPLASDIDDSSAPTYATFGKLLGEAKGNHSGGQAGAGVDKAGTVRAGASKPGVPGLELVHYEPLTGRNIAKVFWDFLNASGPVVVNGRTQTGRLNDPWYYASGLPVTEAYWATVKVAGKPTDVLIQAYERRVLTYIPAYNGSPFAVQMGNVGQHYYDWRYKRAGCANSGGPLPRYGVDPLGQSSAQAVTAMQAAGIQMARLGVNWSEIEPQATNPPTYHWGAYDQAIARLAAGGIHPLLALGACPAWACGDPNGPLTETDPARFGQFVNALALRYTDAPYNVQFWEFFNEPDSTYDPNHQNGFGLHGDQYAALLKATVPGLRAINPQARVLIGGLGADFYMDEQPPGPFNRNFLRDVANAGGGPYFDYLNIHYYPQNPHFTRLADKAAALAAQARAVGLNQPVVCTETGLTTATDPAWQAPNFPPNSEEVQSRYLARTFAEALGGGVQSVTWFTLHDWDNPNPGLQIFLDTGLTRKDWSPKPALGAYRTFVQQVGERPALRTLDAAALGSGVSGYAFGSAGDQVWVVWSTSDAVQTVDPPGSAPPVATDLFGKAVGVSRGRVAVGPNPVYLKLRAP